MRIVLPVDWNLCKAGSVIEVTDTDAFDLINQGYAKDYKQLEILLWTPNFELDNTGSPKWISRKEAN